MDNIRFRPEPADSLGLILNYQCNNRCRHCLYASGPQAADDISFESVKSILKQIKNTIPRCGLHIGGGEPLLQFDLLLRSVAEIRRLGLNLEYVETNGRLLLGPDGRDKLERLKNAGVSCMLLSISPFHNEFMSVADNRRVFDLIVEVFGRDGIFPWHLNYYPCLEKAGAGQPVPWPEYCKQFSHGEIIRQMHEIIFIHPAGRAAFLYAGLFKCRPASFYFDKNCREECASPVHAHIDYRGNYYAGFCSGLRLGEELGITSLYHNGLDLQNYPVLARVINENLGSLYDYALTRGFNETAAGYASACHLCLHIRTFLYKTYPGRHEELEPDFFYREFMKEFGYERIN